ncbi:MGMT family protein [Burkholderiaceae bacterium DAT-1]|nr:MGMT family protein [Burkholderiaceae bacterium DAT-1]
MSSKLSITRVANSLSPLQHALIETVRRVPHGKVASYGMIAALAGYPRHARHVGQALKRLPDNSDAPWWRIVSGDGTIPVRGADGADDQQRWLLEAEGITFKASGKIDMRRHAVE